MKKNSFLFCNFLFCVLVFCSCLKGKSQLFSTKEIVRVNIFEDPKAKVVIDDTLHEINITVAKSVNLVKITPIITTSDGATINPKSGVAQNFEANQVINYTVTAGDGLTQVYKMKVFHTLETAVRAVWIPDPSHTTSLQTYQNVINTVDLLDQLNFNAIYVATWVRTQTAWDSQVLIDNTAWKTKTEGNVFTPYKSAYNTPLLSPTNDPLKDLIEEAHKKGIKVIFWFEYGFMASNGTIPTAANNKILAKHPDWIGKSYEGNVSNYNGSDYYLNAYNPEVQEFLLKLIEESMTLYPDLDGIQGDDRMPAMPRNSGYDSYTVNKYKSEHAGAVPPQNPNEESWVNWRLDILNNFGQLLHDRIKAKKSTALVCFSPNPYPWCEDNLMQQWPTWIQKGIVDLLSVQCYRTTADSYNATVQAAQLYVAGKTKRSIFNPGIILKNGSTIMDEQLLRDQLDINRKYGTNGEAYFYIDGLYDTNVQKVLKQYYSTKSMF